jgi:hypothetical protein
MGWTCGKYGRQERCIQVFGGEGCSLRERDRLEDLDIDGRIILKPKFKNKMDAWTGLICLRIGTVGEM